MLHRVTEEECKIGEYRVPKGVLVYVLFHALHNSSSLWNAPAVYNPDRYSMCSKRAGQIQFNSLQLDARTWKCVYA